MDYSLKKLRNDLEQVRRLLDEGGLFSFSADEMQSLRTAFGDLSRKFAAIDGEYLTIGLLGGTGVGKSTLMNALAGTKIASADHRRPHTDHMLIYRHEEAPSIHPPSLKELPWKEITHRGHAVKQILLCDLPDFDSLVGEHRERVLHFLEVLDVLVWVTSPEKYADGRFYEFLKSTPKAEQNFLFVLNKADLLFQGVSAEEGYRRMTIVMKNFGEYIEKIGMKRPLVYAVCAEEDGENRQASPWNQLPALHQYVFQQRDVKQIQSIKAANLDVEVVRLVEAFQKEKRNLERFQDLLKGLITEYQAERTLWIEAGQQVITRQTEKVVHPDVAAPTGDEHPLIGPGYVLSLWFQAFHKRQPDAKSSILDLSDSGLSGEIAGAFRKRLERVEADLGHRMLQQSLPEALQERFRGILNPARRAESLEEELAQRVAFVISTPPMLRSGLFRILQRIVYLMLFLLLLFALGGDAWQKILTSPGIANMLSLLVTGVQNLFSGKGLAALGSYAVCNLLLASRFYARYKNRLRRIVDRLAKAMKTALLEVWEQETVALQDELTTLEADIQKRISALSHFEPDK